MLLAAGVLGCFANGRHLIPLAAWIAPALLLAALRAVPVRRAVAAGLAVMIPVCAVQWSGVVPVPQPWSTLAAGALAPLVLIPYFADRLVGARLKPAARLLLFPCVQIALESFTSLVSPFASFGALAYTQMAFPAILQVAALTGFWGISFLFALAAPAGAALLVRGGERDWRPAAGFMATAMTVAAFGAIRIASADATPRLVRVAGIAAKPADLAAIYATKAGCGATACAAERADARAQFAAMLQRSDAAAVAGAQLIVWSEVAGTVFAQDYATAAAEVAALARRRQVTIAAAFWVIRPGVRLWENKLVLFGPDGTQRASYLKSRPVPGDLDVLGPGVLPVVPTVLGRLGLAICYDMDFPRLARGATGADILLVPGSDWAAIDPLHARMVALRGVENGYAVVRPSRRSRSAAYDAYGREIARAEWIGNPAPVILAEVPLGGFATPYSRTGDWFPVATLALLVTLLGWPTIARRRIARAATRK